MIARWAVDLAAGMRHADAFWSNPGRGERRNSLSFVPARPVRHLHSTGIGRSSRKGRENVFVFDQDRWSPEALLPIIGGIVWLWCAASFGVVGFLFSMIPGCLLLSSGVSILLWPGDQRIPSFTALGGLLGFLLALPAFFVAGP